MVTAIRLGVLAIAMGLVSLVGVSTASAQAEYNAGGSTAPDGIWFGGGLNAQAGFGNEGVDGAGVRLEAGFPLGTVGPGQFALAVPFQTIHESFGSERFNEATIGIEGQWEYVVPIDMSHRLGIVPFAAFNMGGLWFSGPEDGSFMINFATGASVRFGFDFGLYLEARPLAFSFNIPFGFADHFFAAYEFHFTVGYRLGS
ncbi:MAG: hypothetical protein ACODAU_09245 [Myxococcota bacterium]